LLRALFALPCRATRQGQVAKVAAGEFRSSATSVAAIGPLAGLSIFTNWGEGQRAAVYISDATDAARHLCLSPSLPGRIQRASESASITLAGVVTTKRHALSGAVSGRSLM